MSFFCINKIIYNAKTAEATKVELTAEEIASIQKEQSRAEMIERKRPLTETEVSRMLIAE